MYPIKLQMPIAASVSPGNRQTARITMPFADGLRQTGYFPFVKKNLE
jgi:hypothetical protein